MNITYQRDIEHCEVTPYIKEVTVSGIAPADNSDNLEILSFKEIAWNIVARKGQYNINDKAVFIPPDSVLPFELSEEANITNYLSKGRVKVVKLRGNISAGLILPKEIVEPYIPYIIKWEDPPSATMRGDALPNKDIPFDFMKFLKIPNILNEPNTFRDEEKIVISTKIHGTNARFAKLQHPETKEITDYVGSHNVVLKEGDNLYWNVYNIKLKNKIPEGYVFFGEIFGRGIQHLHYDRTKPDVLIFAISKNCEYLSIEETIQICEEHNIPHVNFHKGIFKNVETFKKIADSPCEYTKSHEREGIVIRSLERLEIMAKCIGLKYLERKNRKERH